MTNQRMIELVAQMKANQAISSQDLAYVVEGAVQGSISEEDLTAWLQVVFDQGMSDEELAVLTDCMARSGAMVDLSGVDGVTVDKHSTGGVGDKITLIVGPLAAACGVKVAKMSGRGLGHTGGTIDKLESIPGFRTALEEDEFIREVNRIGVAVMEQTKDIAPADKVLYALRHKTGLISSIPLIASSVMSKKLAAGAQGIVLDVKVGAGAFMKTLEDGQALAKAMIAIGNANGRKSIALLSDMNRPLGYAIGNALEVREAMDVLQGKGPKVLEEEAVRVTAYMLVAAGKGTFKECEEFVGRILASGAGYERFLTFVKAQGGRIEALPNPSPRKVLHHEGSRGYIRAMDTEGLGYVACHLGANKMNDDDVIDYTAGLVLHAQLGDVVEHGQPLASFYGDAVSEAQLAKCVNDYMKCITIDSIEEGKESPHMECIDMVIE